VIDRPAVRIEPLGDRPAEPRQPLGIDRPLAAHPLEPLAQRRGHRGRDPLAGRPGERRPN
jgi:hypothetical protein